MFYKWILSYGCVAIFLMLPAIAWGQSKAPSVPSIDTFYIDFCDSNSVADGDDNIDGWLLPGVTLYIDTSEGGGGGADADSIRGKPVTQVAPTDNYILKYDQALDSLMYETDLTGSGLWIEGTDTLFAIDSDGDTIAVFWDDDAGNVRWQTGIEDQTLGILMDSLFSVFIHITDNNASLKLEDDSGNYGILKTGNSQICLGVDPENLVVSSDICFDIDGNEVARFHQNSNLAMGLLIPPEKISIVGNIALGDTTTGDTDAYISFGDDGAWSHTLTFDDGLDEFQFNNDLYVGGTILSLDTLTKSFVIASPDDTFDFPFWQTKRAITITAVSAVCTGGTNLIGALDEYNATGTAVDVAVDGDWTILTTEFTDASFTNPGIDAGDWLGFHVTSVSGTVNFISLTFEYVEQ